MRTSIVLGLTGLSALCAAQSYVLEDDYQPATFFNDFEFFTGTDPTNGYVTYLDQSDASNGGLISTNNGSIYMGVDHQNVASGSGRDSVRIASTKTYNHGLIILDLAHMPGGICGTWPAFWMLGPDWPTNGEIDIIEGVNSQTSNDMTLHTDAGCSITKNSADPFTGNIGTSNCDVNAAGQAANAGCSIDATSSNTFGAGFNAIGGGVYATDWTSQSINIYFFPRTAIPADITSGSPNPSGWGEPLAAFSGGCDIDAHVLNQQIVFDTTFCGDWAGNVWTTDATCAPLASTCNDYVQNNPSAFADAYWLVNSLRVYQQSGSSPTSSSSASSSAPTVSSTTAVSSATTFSTAAVTTSTAILTLPTTITTSAIQTTFGSTTTTALSSSETTTVFSSASSTTASYSSTTPSYSTTTPSSYTTTYTSSSMSTTWSSTSSWTTSWPSPSTTSGQWPGQNNSNNNGFGQPGQGQGQDQGQGQQGGSGGFGRRRARRA